MNDWFKDAYTVTKWDDTRFSRLVMWGQMLAPPPGPAYQMVLVGLPDDETERILRMIGFDDETEPWLKKRTEERT